MYLGFSEDAQGMNAAAGGMGRDAQRMQWRMQKGLQGGPRAGRRGAGTFEDVIREQSGHLLIPLLHGKQDCEGTKL